MNENNVYNKQKTTKDNVSLQKGIYLENDSHIPLLMKNKVNVYKTTWVT